MVVCDCTKCENEELLNYYIYLIEFGIYDLSLYDVNIDRSNSNRRIWNGICRIIGFLKVVICIFDRNIML